MNPDQQNINTPKVPNMKPLYRGVWAEYLVSGQELPVGGYLFNNDLTKKLVLDFDAFEDQCTDFTKETLLREFEKNKMAVTEWLNKTGSSIDPYLFFICSRVQEKMQNLLDAKAEPNRAERQKMYGGDSKPRLSQLKGKGHCAERAAMGQFLLQRIGEHSAYMNGITMTDARDEDDEPSDHAFIIINNPNNPSENFIFDIARPRSQHNLPRVLKPSVLITYELLQGKSELLVKAKEVLQGGELWFGVGAPVFGKHDIVE